MYFLKSIGPSIAGSLTPTYIGLAEENTGRVGTETESTMLFSLVRQSKAVGLKVVGLDPFDLWQRTTSKNIYILQLVTVAKLQF